ncbi:collagen-like protein [Mucilaginibacter sp. X4EP1]|uniref:collagen-like protein n=1 Tax=Mucilaginibacter sp. X4EP1 TaxID=2723092 RepID=UPI00216A2EAD|nr:collagen-like protein [Mucilaginibacter sp. X4EP1]MCS3816173.1 hypothetical protein [Mucilaginibacter sp. X4EP1]
MPTDKKITDLPIATVINAMDVSVLVDGGTDYQYNFTLLLQFLEANLNTGAGISFGTVLPQNTSGNNGDVFVNTTSGSFAQKVAETWTVVYTLPNPSAADGTLLYGAGTPASTTGKNGDSYVNTLTGVFYEKTNNAWSQVFSMASGPQGPQGIAGTNGTNGINGNTLLYGTTNPANNTTGADGNFYINTSSYLIFGPRAAGVWPAGVSMLGNDGATGPQGPAGPIGATGANGQGVPAGGTTGQVLAKNTNTDYDTSWQNNSHPTATTTTAGIAALATVTEALAGTDNANIMTALTTLSVILDQQKNIQYGINPVSLNEVSILMQNAGNVLSSLIANLTNLKLKIGYAASYSTDAQTYPFAYNAGDTVLITYSFSDPNNLRGNLKLICRDN